MERASAHRKGAPRRVRVPAGEGSRRGPAWAVNRKGVSYDVCSVCTRPFHPGPGTGEQLSPSPIMGTDFLLLGGMTGPEDSPRTCCSPVILVLKNPRATVGCFGTLPWAPTPCLISVRHAHDRRLEQCAAVCVPRLIWKHLDFGVTHKF